MEGITHVTGGRLQKGTASLNGSWEWAIDEDGQIELIGRKLSTSGFATAGPFSSVYIVDKTIELPLSLKNIKFVSISANATGGYSAMDSTPFQRFTSGNKLYVRLSTLSTEQINEFGIYIKGEV